MLSFTWTSNLDRRVSYFPSVVGLVSVFFILLIMFLISNSIVSWPGITVHLPQMDAVEISAADKLIVTITQEDDIFFNGLKISWDDLERELGEKVRDSELGSMNVTGKKNTTRLPTIVVCADKQVRLESLARLMDIARGLGMEVVMVAEPNSSEPPVFRLTSPDNP